MIEYSKENGLYEAFKNNNKITFKMNRSATIKFSQPFSSMAAF